MKNFYDRVREMNELRELQRQAYNDYSRFVVLTGRRRVGKTSLVYRLISETREDAPGLYFFVGRKTETILVRTFIQEVREKLGEFVPEGMSSARSSRSSLTNFRSLIISTLVSSATYRNYGTNTKIRQTYA